MRDILEKIEYREWTSLEIILAVLTALFSGIVIGVVISPKGKRIYGSYNGNSGLEELEEFDDLEAFEDIE